MGTLTVWKFDTPEGADRAEAILIDLSKQQLIDIGDAATVSWPADRKKPKTRQLATLTGPGAGWGALWGMLFGLIFFVPLLGAAIGAGLGALAGHFSKRRDQPGLHRVGAAAGDAGHVGAVPAVRQRGDRQGQAGAGRPATAADLDEPQHRAGAAAARRLRRRVVGAPSRPGCRTALIP